MKILIAHNRYQEPGGEDRVVAQEAAMLERHGHQVELFLVDNDSIQNPIQQLTAAARSIYSPSAAARLGKLLDTFAPNILHVHNFLPNLSPSAFFVANRRQIPTVQTLHNYRLNCANALLFRDGHTCEECPSSHSFLPGIRHACYRGSRLGSAVVGGGMALHAAVGTWSNRVDRYIALTHFAAQKLSSFRVPADRIRVKPNFVADTSVGPGTGKFALFAGRLSPEKGLATLIDADASGSLPLPIKIAGDGPLMPSLQSAASRPGSKLELLGSVDRPQLQSLMREARSLVFPSLWYEVCPMVILESLAAGLPVVSSRIGGLPEILGDQHPETFFEAGNSESLIGALERVASSDRGHETLRTYARQCYETHFTEELNYAQLLNIYSELLPEHEA